MNAQATPQPETRTAQDGYNRLLAIAFEERVNATAYGQQLEQKLALAGQIIEGLRNEAKAKEDKIAALKADLESVARHVGVPLNVLLDDAKAASTAAPVSEGGTPD